jgi:cation diffusion facilitator family transporter
LLLNINAKNIEKKEKWTVAFASILAAIFLTAMKLIVGLVTGSLGILSEALHSGLDLIAAIMTFFAVKIADKPPDKEHNFGHGKVENLSALFETLLLLITCVWIVWEAVVRLSSGEIIIKVTIWSYTVVIISIIVDITRSRRLMKIAKKYNSQALEADALHFSTDILSSFVVLLGLVGASYGFYSADAFAALVVALIVVGISFRLGKRAIDVLLDRSPANARAIAENILGSCSEVKYYHDVKVRSSGATTFIAATIHVEPTITIEEAHRIAERVESEIKREIPNSQILIHQEPDIDPEDYKLK